MISGSVQSGKGVELWFLTPAAILRANDEASMAGDCRVALEKAAKQLNGAYVTIKLNSDAIVCVSPHQTGIAQVKVHSGPVEFRVAYSFQPLDGELRGHEASDARPVAGRLI